MIQNTIIALGYVGVFVAIFAETGLLVGFFLPGDSLLFTIGILASQNYFNVWWLVIGGTCAAIMGDSIGYYLGYKFGPKVFKKESSFLFNKNHIEKTKLFYEKHGEKTIILARFVPIVRTFAPTLAGIGHMRYRTFITYNIIGSVLWVPTFMLCGYFLGKRFSNLEQYTPLVSVVIILISILPFLHEYIKNKFFKKDSAKL